MKLTQNNIAPTKSNIIKELDLSDYVINSLTMTEGNRELEIIKSNIDMLLHSLPPDFNNLFESKLSFLGGLADKNIIDAHSKMFRNKIS